MCVGYPASGIWGKSSEPQKGFDHWFAHKSGGGPYYNAPFYRNGRLEREPDYVTDVITDDAIEFLREYAGREKPFYLQVDIRLPMRRGFTIIRKNIPRLYEDCPFESCPMEKEHPDSIYLTK